MFLTIVHIILCGSQDEKIKPLMLFEDFETKTFLLKGAKIEVTEISNPFQKEMKKFRVFTVF